MIAALVPVKALGAGKSRLLSSGIDRGDVERLTAAMLEDVLGCLGAVDRLGAAAVVTEDPAVAAIAKDSGARALLRSDRGLNPSLEAAARELAAGGATAVLVVLGDVAGALPGDLVAMLSALDELGGRGVVLAPSRDGGTGALLRAPHDAIPPEFGPDSAARHRALAAAADVPFRELALASLELDVDRPEDLAALAELDAGAERTRAVLTQLKRRSRP